MVFKAETVGVAVPTYQGAKQIRRCLTPVTNSPLNPRLLVVDSSSRDGTAEIAAEMGAEIVSIPQHAFNHGTTRELARRKLGTDIVVFVTQDAILEDGSVLEKLIEPIRRGAAVSYARQIPHDGAGFFEAFPRLFNYPDKSELRTYADIHRLGAHTFFCSNSCCAWSNAALDEIGGFAETASLEDTIAVAKLLRAGHAIAYSAEARVKHSHRHSLQEEFQRYFDIGHVRSRNKDLLFPAGGDGRRGADFARTMLLQLAKRAPHMLPYALMTIGAKYAGYRVGSRAHTLPLWLARRLSAQKHFWEAGPERAGTARVAAAPSYFR